VRCGLRSSAVFPAIAAKSVLQTIMTINPQEFDRYEVDPGTEESVDVTFSLRECKVGDVLRKIFRKSSGP
jgi:Rad9